MGLRIGIIGLANVGKSTLFNALLGRQAALTAPYPFATVEPNIGVVDVPDERLIKLRDTLFPVQKGISKTVEQYNGKAVVSKSVTGKPVADITDLPAYRPTDYRSTVLPFHRSTGQPPLVFATVTFVDIAGLVKGAAEGKGLGNQFLSHIRDVDLILHVLRDFDEGIPRAEDSKNPEDDAEIVKMELELKDLEVAERKSSTSNTGSTSSTGGGLAEKPVIYAVNVGEDKLTQILEHSENSSGKTVKQYNSETVVSKSVDGEPVTDMTDLSAYCSTDYRSTALPLHCSTDSPVFYFCAKLEEEISKMPKNEQKEYLKIYGLKQSCLDRIISECFQALGLISFFTAPASAKAPTAAKDSAGKPAGQAGKWEIRAWPIKKDSAAPQAAAVIHSDFEKLFIRAEVIGWEKLAEVESWQEARNRGWIRTEGKEYLIQDGDVVNFLIGK